MKVVNMKREPSKDITEETLSVTSRVVRWAGVNTMMACSGSKKAARVEQRETQVMDIS